MKMYLAGNLKMSLLNSSFAMISRVHKMSVLISMFSISIVGMNYLKDNIFECFFKRYNRLKSFVKEVKFFHNIQ